MRQKKPSVCMGLKNNEKGYTFASLLLTITTVLVTMPVIILLLQIVIYDSDESHMDAHHFFNFLYTDVLLAEDVEVNEKEDIIYFWVENEARKQGTARASIEKYDDTIRRTVAGKGHEIYLRNIENFHVVSISYGFQVTLEFKNGEKYEKTIEHTSHRK